MEALGKEVEAKLVEWTCDVTGDGGSIKGGQEGEKGLVVAVVVQRERERGRVHGIKKFGINERLCCLNGPHFASLATDAEMGDHQG